MPLRTLESCQNFPKVILEPGATSGREAAALHAQAEKVQKIMKDGIPNANDLKALGDALARTHLILKQESQKEGVVARICHFFARLFGLKIDPEVELSKGFQTLMLGRIAEKEKAWRKERLRNAKALVLQGKHDIQARIGKPLGITDKELEYAVVLAHTIDELWPLKSSDEGHFLRPKNFPEWPMLKRTLYRDQTGIYLVYNQNRNGPHDPYVGRGAIKDVKYGHNLLTGQTVARQTIKFIPDPDDDSIAHAENDIANLKLFANQPGQVKVITYSKPFFSKKRNFPKIHVIMPLYQQVALGSVKNLNLTRLQKLNLLLQMAQSVAFIHNQGRGHGDIKPENFLIDDAGQICLNDYGAVFIHGTVSEACTPGYAAPEVNEEDRPGKKPRTRKRSSDIYSLGLTYQGLFTDIVYTNERIRKLHDDMMAYDRRGRPTIHQVITTLEQEIAREQQAHHPLDLRS